MRDSPPVEEVRRYLDIGFEHLDDEDAEESIRLLTLRAFEPFGLTWRTGTDPAERERSFRSGILAAELARGVGRSDLESAALDGAGSAIIDLGLYGQSRLVNLLERRMAIAEVTEDPWEAGDIYAMGAWNRAMIGDYEFDKGLWFEPAPGHTVGNMVIHLKSGDARSVLSGDVLHHPLHWFVRRGRAGHARNRPCRPRRAGMPTRAR